MKERISPIGLKGNQITERIKELMGIQPVIENKKTSVVELTKLGPDGNVYGIVRENHEYYIKMTNKKENLKTEDFLYIGGLKNKKQEAYPSYAKAIKHLNLKFNSLNEAYGKSGQINVFQDDNLLNENIGGFYNQRESMFKNEGNLEGQAQSECCNAPIMDGMCSECGGAGMYNEEKENNPWAICTASVGRENQEKYEKCVMAVKKRMELDEIGLSEEEQAVQDMMEFDDDNAYQDEEDPYGDLIDFSIPDWAGSYLINGDPSGLEDEDIEKVDRFVDRIVAKYGNANFIMPNTDDEMDLGFCHTNDIDNLGSDCIKLYIRPDESNMDEVEIKNAGEYINGPKAKLGIDSDGDGVPNGADKNPHDGSIHEDSLENAIYEMEQVLSKLKENLKKKVR